MNRNIDRILQDFNLGDNLSLDRLSELTQITQAGMVTLIVSLVFSLLLCFLGLKLIKLWSGLAGLMVGASVGLTASLLIGLTGVAVLIVVLLAGILMLVLSVIFKRLGMFWVCLFAGASIGTAVMYINVFAGLIVIVAAGLLAAILGAVVQDPIVIIMTSIQGGLVSAAAVMGLIGINNQIVQIAAAVVLGALGMVAQFMLKSREIGKKESVWSNSVREEQSRESEVEAARSIIDAIADE